MGGGGVRKERRVEGGVLSFLLSSTKELKRERGAAIFYTPPSVHPSTPLFFARLDFTAVIFSSLSHAATCLFPRFPSFVS